MKYAFGIDLGTTNSCIAVKTKGASATVIKLENGMSTLPSCVMYKDGKIIVGMEAYEHRYDVKHVVYSSKRDIGSDKKYTVYANGDDNPPIDVTPVDVAAEILKKLKHDAELIYGEGFITEATITVPAYFTYECRAATIEAATLAGIRVVSLINEPTSAAIAYTEGRSDNEKILVYDLGGGTFDVTLLNMLKPQSDLADLFGEENVGSIMAKVVSSSGNRRLGGDDLDMDTYLFSLKDAASSLSQMLNKDITADMLRNAIEPEVEEKILLIIEGLKKSGSTVNTSIPLRLTIPSITSDYPYSLAINHTHFEKAVQIIFKKTVKLVDECLKGVNLSSLSKIIMVGGSTKLEMLRKMIYKRYNIATYTYLNPDEAVALGAAVYTSINYGETNMNVSDILPQSIGIERTTIRGEQLMEGRYKILIPKDTALPASAVATLTTRKGGQTRAVAPVYQGEDPIAANNFHIGNIAIEIEPSEEEVPVSITLAVDASGILTAKLSSQDRAVSATLQNILQPSTKKITIVDKMTQRFKILLKQVEGDEAIAEGTLAIEKFSRGDLDYTSLKEIFDKLPRKSEYAVKHSDDAVFAKATDRFSLSVEDDNNEEYEEEFDEE